MSKELGARTVARAPVDVIAVGVIALASLELLHRTASVFQWRFLQSSAVALPWAGLLLVGIAVGLRAPSYKWAGFVVGGLTLAALILMVLRFRGLWIWPGTFDYYFAPTTAWIWSLPAGFAVGTGLAYLLGSRVGPTSRAWIWIGALIASGMVTLAMSYFWAKEIDSLFPPTRAYVYLALVVPLAYAQYQGD